ARTHTRRFGLSVGGVVIGLALLAVFRSAGNPELAGRWALGQSLVLVLVAAVLSRVIGDSAAGAVAGLLALPYAFVGAALAVARPNPWPDLVASQFEVACAVTVLGALLAAFAVGSDNAPFAAVTVAGLLGVLGGWLTSSHGMSPPHVACVLLCVALLATPLFNALAIWLARVPIPALPRSATDLIRDQRLPPRAVVYAAVARADGLLTGLLAGTATTAAVADVLLVRDPDVMANWLVVITSAAYLVRARTYVTVRQRLPLLLAGVTGPAALLIGPAMHDPGDRLSTAGPLLFAFGALAIVAGLGYARKEPGPYLRRYVEILEVLLILAVLPVAAAVLGLYARMHGLG
ncbi:MAG: type VII secretion integral membrane protein EccD, partial [Pseudonocardiales bacterium]